MRFAVRACVLLLTLGFTALLIRSEALKAISSSRIYAANSQVHIQDLSAAPDGVWFLIRNFSNRSIALKKVSWDGGVTSVREDLSPDYVGIATQDGQDVYLSKSDGTTEHYGSGMSLVNHWKLPYVTPYQVIIGGRLITVREGEFVSTSLENQRSVLRPVPTPSTLGPITNLERADDESAILFSGVTGRFLKLNVREGGVEEGEIPSAALAFRTEWSTSSKTDPKSTPIRMSVAAFTVNQKGELLVIPNPVTPSSARLLHLSGSGQVSRDFALDLNFPDPLERMHAYAMAVESQKLMIISAHGLVKIFLLPN